MGQTKNEVLNIQNVFYRKILKKYRGRHWLLNGGIVELLTVKGYEEEK